MDKALESTLGFINVLPGAFSSEAAWGGRAARVEARKRGALRALTFAVTPAVYRWVAIRGEPLAAYFTLEETAARDLEPFTCNMFLAEVGGSLRGSRPHNCSSRSRVAGPRPVL